MIENVGILFTLIGFVFVCPITPGPNNLMVMSSGAAFGWRKATPHMDGIAGGFAMGKRQVVANGNRSKCSLCWCRRGSIDAHGDHGSNFLVLSPICNSALVIAGQSLRSFMTEGANAQVFSVLVAASAIFVLFRA